MIIDEVHNVMSMVVNPKSHKGRFLYKFLMNVTDCKFLLMSATPLLNTPFELASLFNILKGKINGQTLFPEESKAFDPFFIDYHNRRAMNADLFQRRILGMVSYYYGGEYKVYPDVIQYKPIEMNFPNDQFAQYKQLRLIEIEENKKETSNQES